MSQGCHWVQVLRIECDSPGKKRGRTSLEWSTPSALCCVLMTYKKIYIYIFIYSVSAILCFDDIQELLCIYMGVCVFPRKANFLSYIINVSTKKATHPFTFLPIYIIMKAFTLLFRLYAYVCVFVCVCKIISNISWYNTIIDHFHRYGCF